MVKGLIRERLARACGVPAWGGRRRPVPRSPEDRVGRGRRPPPLRAWLSLRAGCQGDRGSILSGFLFEMWDV